MLVSMPLDGFHAGSHPTVNAAMHIRASVSLDMTGRSHPRTRLIACGGQRIVQHFPIGSEHAHTGGGIR